MKDGATWCKGRRVPLQHFQTMAKLRAGSLFVVVILWLLLECVCKRRAQGGVSLSTICHSVLVAVFVCGVSGLVFYGATVYCSFYMFLL